MTREFLKANINIIAAFAAVYILWGSTYLGIKYAIETIPPLMMASGRFLIAGLLLSIWTIGRGTPLPTMANLKNILVVSILLLVIGNGCVVLAEKYISSGMAALLITIEPLWVVLLQLKNGKKTEKKVWLGLALGITGMFFLTGPAGIGGLEQTNLLGVFLVMLSTLAWAGGSLFSASKKITTSPILSTGIQMLLAGGVFSVLSFIAGEWTEFSFQQVTLESWVALFYLIICGSLIGFTCYIWLIKKASPGRVSTYAYVNPVIAVFLGFWIGGESINLQTIIALPMLITAVILILTQKKEEKPAETAFKEDLQEA